MVARLQMNTPMAIGRVRDPITPGAEGGSRNHVHQHEGRHEPAELCIGEAHGNL